MMQFNQYATQIHRERFGEGQCRWDQFDCIPLTSFLSFLLSKFVTDFAITKALGTTRVSDDGVGSQACRTPTVIPIGMAVNHINRFVACKLHDGLHIAGMRERIPDQHALIAHDDRAAHIKIIKHQLG